MKNNLKIEVSGPTAARQADAMLESLELSPSEIEAIDIVLQTVSKSAEDEDKTNTTFHTAGPGAGAIAAQMIGALDNEAHSAEYIKVEVTTVSAEPEQPELVDGKTDGGPVQSVDGPRSMPDSVITKEMPDDFGTTESPVDEPLPLSEGTLYHERLAMLAAYEMKYPNEMPVSAPEVREEFSDKNSQASVSTTFSKLFRNKGYLRRVQSDREVRGVRLNYHMDEDGWNELERLGWPADIEPTENTEMRRPLNNQKH